MTEVRYGQLTVRGTDAFVASVHAVASASVQIIGGRIQPAVCVELEPDQMPKLTPTSRALGVWSESRRMIGISTLNREAAKTLGHELVHVLDSDWFTRWNRRQLCALLAPQAQSWADVTIGDTVEPYRARPEECSAVWGSAALFGFDRPAFSTYYLRRIPRDRWPATKAAMLESDPALEVDRLREQIAELESDLAAAQTEAGVWKAAAESCQLTSADVALQLDAQAARLRGTPPQS